VPPATPSDNTTTPPRDPAPPERHTARPGAAPRTSRRHIGVVFNPATSPDDAPARKRELLAALQTAEVEVLWLETTEQDAGQGLTRQALKEGVDLVLAAGGDGTVMACVTALAGSGVPLAVLPLGTGNLLAGYLDLPEDLDGALDVALHGEHRELDVGALDGGSDRFVLMAGLGFDAAMLRNTDPGSQPRPATGGPAGAAALWVSASGDVALRARLLGALAQQSPQVCAWHADHVSRKRHWLNLLVVLCLVSWG
jgi:diacylglycerol kinase family enzyme